MRNAPCNGCGKRYPGCHTECTAYATWKRSNDEIRDRTHGEKVDDWAVCKFLMGKRVRNKNISRDRNRRV